MSEISEELDNLSIALIQTAIDMLDIGVELPVMLATDCEEGLVTFEDDSPDGCYWAACEHVRKLGAQANRYVILYNGFVQEDETSSSEPALLFEFGERGMGNAWSGYLLYRTGENGEIEVSDPLPAGMEELLLS